MSKKLTKQIWRLNTLCIHELHHHNHHPNNKKRKILLLFLIKFKKCLWYNGCIFVLFSKIPYLLFMPGQKMLFQSVFFNVYTKNTTLRYVYDYTQRTSKKRRSSLWQNNKFLLPKVIISRRIRRRRSWSEVVFEVEMGEMAHAMPQFIIWRDFLGLIWIFCIPFE